MSNYYAIIGDLIESRKIEKRDEAQKQLNHALQNVNRRFSAMIASKFVVTLGDEFQGLLHLKAPLFEMLDWIASDLPAYPFRVGIGFGSMETSINPEESIGADGEAFWHARAAIEFIHDNNDYGTTAIGFLGLDEMKTQTINDLLAATDLIKSNWTPLQRETFNSILSQGIYSDDFSQKKCAQNLQISEVAFYKRLKSSNIKLYLRCRSNLQNTLEKWTNDSAQ